MTNDEFIRQIFDELLTNLHSKIRRAEAGSALPIASDGRHFFGPLPRRYFGAALYTNTLRRPGIAFGHAHLFFLGTVARLGSSRCYISRQGDSPFWLETAK